MNSKLKLNTLVANTNIHTKEKYSSINLNNNLLLNKTLEGVKRLQTTVEKSKILKKIEKNKVFISKFTRASSTGIYSDYSSQRYNEIQTIDKSPFDHRDDINIDKFSESNNTERLSNNFYRNIKIKDLKRNNYRQKISISRNLKKDLSNSQNKNLPKQKYPIKSDNLINPFEDTSITRNKSVGKKRKLTFTYNQSIPILLQKSKDRSKIISLNKILKQANDNTLINYQDDFNTIEPTKIKSSRLNIKRIENEKSYEHNGEFKDVDMYIRNKNRSINSSDSEERDVFPIKSNCPNKGQLMIKEFLKSKSNKLNMNIEKDDFFKTKTNLVNYFEEMYRVPHFKNKLFNNNNEESEYMFEKTKGTNNEINLNNIEFNRDYHNYLIKLEKLKMHNNLDLVSTFFLNSWKRKFQERKDKEALKFNVDEAQNKILEDEKGNINKNILFNEHTFLEYLQYKYDKHCQNINFADIHSRTRILKAEKERKWIKSIVDYTLNISKIVIILRFFSKQYSFF